MIFEDTKSTNHKRKNIIISNSVFQDITKIMKVVTKWEKVLVISISNKGLVEYINNP